MNLAQRFRKYREKLNLTQEKTAEMAKVSQQTIQKIEAGLIKMPRNIKVYAKIFHTTPECLQFGVGDNPPPKNMRDVWENHPHHNYIPMLEWSEILQWVNPYAEPLDMDENKRDFVESPVPDNPERKRFFAVRVKNDTMTASSGAILSFPPKTILIADPDMYQQCQSGDFLIGYQSKAPEPIFRQYIIDGDKHFLKPLNPQYPTEEMAVDFSVLALIIERRDMFI